MAKLSDEAMRQALTGLPGWNPEEGALTKAFVFSTFPDGIAFVNQVADVAEEMGHHPDITINYTRVTLQLSTHDEGGITEKDIALAQRIESLRGR